MSERKVLGIILARGGSKGIPRKNIKLLCGRPLITYTIDAALKAGTIDRLVVSTDDAEIADIAREAGAEVPFLRPAEYATDRSSCIQAIHHAMDFLLQNEGYFPDVIAFLPPTSPLRTSEQIDDAVRLLWSSGFDSVVTIYPTHDHPYDIYTLGKDKQLVEIMRSSNKAVCRQDLPEYYAYTQAIILSLSKYIRKCTISDLEFNLQSLAGLTIDRESAWDIDTPSDFFIAESLMVERIKKTEGPKD